RRARALLAEEVSPPFHDVPDAGKALEKLGIGSALTGKELLELSHLIMVGARIFDATEGLGILPDPYYLVPLARDIQSTFDPDGGVLDDATPTLRKLRESKRRQRQRVVSMMERVAEKYRDSLRDEVITVRGGRFVLAFSSSVKTDGIVHGYSRTTETQYVEPLECVEEQNRLVRLEDEEREEVSRIISELTERARANAGFLRDLYESIGKADLVWAKARYADAVGACVPEIIREKGLVLKGVRHPILLSVKGRDETVPLDLRIGPYVKALIFTGPNAGGKTVAMKTVALAFLAGAAGLPYPGDEVRVWLPDEVFALGFEEGQSIERGTSSFTGLLEEVSRVIEGSGPGTVAFFDEVLSSTDPTEGGALAFAILKKLMDKGTVTFSTTHLSVLKNLASGQDGFLTAAAELGPDGNPTYSFRLGEVAGSYAIESARRAGFPEDVIFLAEAAMEGYGEEMAMAARRVAQLEAELKARIAEQKTLLADASAERERILASARAEARRIISAARKDVEELVKKLREEAKAERRLASARKARTELRKAEASMDRTFSVRAENPEPGREYRVSPMGFVGELIELRGGKALLLVGNATVEVDSSALYEV
ncbi:MAG: MutS-related protein, partial [Candidatus Hydrothermia bacterium]